MISNRSLFIALVSGLAAHSPFAQSVPSTINYQGRLTDNSLPPAPVNATVNMRFEIWDDPVAGSRLWQEPAGPATTPVPVTGGIFNVLLGASAGSGSVPIPASLFSTGSTSRYLQIIVNGENLTPRQPVSATSYANQAQNAAQAVTATTATNAVQLGGVAASGYQLATIQNCGSGQFVSAIANGSATCAPALSSIPVPLALSGSVEGTPIISGSNTNGNGGSGVFGASAGAGGSGVQGYASATSGVNFGVFGLTYSPAGIAGFFDNQGGGSALYSRGLMTVESTTNSVENNTARFSANGLVGTKYDSHIHYGTRGDWYIRSALAMGKVVLQDTGGDVTIGTNSILGKLTVFTDASNAGIYSRSSILGGTGIVGQAIGSGSPQGIWGICTGCASTGYAGYFTGNVNIAGTLSKSAGSFKIDHPLDPENKYLYHSFVESPDMMNIYNGNIVTDGKGEATVTMPDWFEALNRDFRYQLTVIGEFAHAIVGKKIVGNRFTIRTDKPNIEVSWMVTGIRKDHYAEKHRIPVVQEKSAAERGFYIHPGDYGLPEEMGVEWGTHPELMRKMKQERENAQAPPEAPAAP